MSNSFRILQDALDASRRGDSLYSIYQALEESEDLLNEHQKNAFELLFEMLISSLTEEQAQELARFPTEGLEVYVTNISSSIAQVLSLFNGKKLFLNKLELIDEATAKALAQWKGDWLYLN